MRENRFNREVREEKRSRSLSEQMNDQQMKQYQQMRRRSLRREKSELSHKRYNKMKCIILLEVKHAI